MNKVFNDADEKKQITCACAGVALHALLAGGRMSDQTTDLVAVAFSIAERYVAEVERRLIS